MNPEIQVTPPITDMPDPIIPTVTARSSDNFGTMQGTRWWILGMGLTLALVAGIFFQVITARNSKVQAIKTISQSVTDELGRLAEKNILIGEELKKVSSGATKQDRGNMVLGTTSGISLEDQPMIQESRRMIEMFRDATTQADKIGGELSKLENELIGVWGASFKSGAPIDKTKTLIADVRAIYKYFEDYHHLSIKVASAGFDYGVALGALSQSPSLDALERLEETAKEFEKLAKDELKLASGQTSAELLKLHQVSVGMTGKMVKIFTDIPAKIRNQDAAGLKNLVEELAVLSVSSQQTFTVQVVNYWQNEAVIRNVPDLRQEWVGYKQRL